MSSVSGIGASGAPGVRTRAIAADPSPISASGTREPSSPAAKKEAQIAKVAKEFEAVLVRQVLTAAKAAGEASSSQYGGMAIDALADGIMHGGGLGLARSLVLELSDVARRAELRGASHSPVNAASTSNANGASGAPTAPKS
jgi:Rod binding domain-containing protein